MRFLHARHVSWLGTSLLLLLACLAPALSPTPEAHATVMSATDASAGVGGLALGVYRPELPDDMHALNAYERETGSPLALVHWYADWGGWKSDFSLSDLQVVARHGSLPMITWEPWSGTPRDPAWSLAASILSGRSDSYIHTWARGLAAYGGPVLLRFAHEMHDQSYPWAIGINGNTAEAYVAAWRYVHAIFVQEGATNVRWVWNPNTMPGTRRETYQTIYASLYPGDDVVDWVGLDIYNGGSALPDWGGWRTFSDALSEPYQALNAVANKPIVLAEVGSAEAGGAKAAWMRSAYADLQAGRFPMVRALVWFDVNKEATWAVQSSPDALSAWLGMVDQAGSRAITL